MSDRERAREMLTLLWGECDYDQAATAIATELAQARAEGLRQAAAHVESNTGEILYSWQAMNLAARLRALAEGGE